MTTAARPTFAPAKGGTQRGEKNLGSLSKQYSSRDLPANLKLKYRQSGQGTSDELKNKDFKRDLEERERIAAHEKEIKRGGSSSAGSIGSSSKVSAITSSSKKARLEAQPPVNIDADDPIEESESDEDSDDDDDEDDTAELLAELNRIKRERAQEEAKREAERKVQEEKIRMENILSGNPLLSGNSKADFKVKRRWDDDVVFKNCARNDMDKKDKPFINDTLRSEFHKKFMEKYIK